MRKANLKTAAIFFGMTLVAQIIFMAVLVPMFSQASGGLAVPDMSLFRPYAESRAAFDVMKAGEGLFRYRLFELLDIVFPLLYGLAFAVFLGLGLKRLGKGDTAWNKLLLLPLAAALFDYLENILVFSMIAIHPGDFSALAPVVNLVGLLKFLCFGLSLAAMLGILIAVAILSGRKTCVSTVRAPAAIGPYSQAVSAGGFLFVSGQLGMDPESGALAEGLKAQAERALDNLCAILEDNGMTMADVVKTTIFLTNMSDFQAVNEIYASYFTGDFPARSTIQVAALPKSGLVEIEAVARAK